MGTHAVSIHHRNLDRWLQRGGHIAVEDVSKRAAAREVVEETGFAQFLANGEKNPLFDVDNYLIPARSEVPEHVHHDLRFLLCRPSRSITRTYDDSQSWRSARSGLVSTNESRRWRHR